MKYQVIGTDIKHNGKLYKEWEICEFPPKDITHLLESGVLKALQESKENDKK